MDDKVVIDVLQNDVVKSVVGIVLTAILTYLVTMWTQHKNKSMSVMEIQLKNIYLPLYQLIQKDAFSERELNNIFENMNNKKRKYYIYLSNTYLHICNRLGVELENNCVSKNTIKRCRAHITFEYLRLKRELGFPYKKEFGNCYLIYYIFKVVFQTVSFLVLFVMGLWSVLGYEIYILGYEQLVANTLLTLLIMDAICFLIYVFYKLFLYENCQ